ncbi:undecaprenyl-diphosphatase [Paenibacillus albiflavus]|uniref:Undecaprenyl-diphosphatase n=1 Tax=Paenibacillus albiflavus TaxID=2545760 RepID=A0A4R4EB86_9BACL|nr:undecaprenyl-diphosphatase [Paenibacillus albiflavus]TCZ75401.1 undecaprenyl-diphosphatase [Paenibacillus albiflavus]
MLQLDYQLFELINNLTEKISFLNPIMIFLASRAEYLFYAAVIIYWFTRTDKNRRMVFVALVSAAIGLGISVVLGDFFYRDRPFVAHEVFQLVPHAVNASFPSDHATASFAIAMSIWFYRRKEGWLWLALAAAISFSRVWVGVHYPLDVTTGMVNGVLCALLIHLVFSKWSPAKKLLEGILKIYNKIEQSIWKKK